MVHIGPIVVKSNSFCLLGFRWLEDYPWLSARFYQAGVGKSAMITQVVDEEMAPDRYPIVGEARHKNRWNTGNGKKVTIYLQLMRILPK